jgi:hypothetical protein
MEEAFVNSTSWVGEVFSHMSINITGSEYLTILAILVLLIVIMMMFRVPMLFIFLFVSPLVMIGMAYYQEFYIIGLVFFAFLGITVAANFFFQNR